MNSGFNVINAYGEDLTAKTYVTNRVPTKLKIQLKIQFFVIPLPDELSSRTHDVINITFPVNSSEPARTTINSTGNTALNTNFSKPINILASNRRVLVKTTSKQLNIM